MKASKSKIVFIGAGNVASVLAKAMQGKYEILQVYSRKAASAKRLADKIKCSYTMDLKKIRKDSDVYIIAVKDDAIASIAGHLKLGNKTILHTSGSVSADVLSERSSRYGVLYPLQTFSANSKLKSGVPFCIEGSDKNVQKVALTLVKDIKGKAYIINSQKRQKLHLAAVFANNFSNHMFAVASEICKKEGLEFTILLPLIDETVAKLSIGTPMKNQTGPARRHDAETIKKHEHLLKNNSAYLKLYKAITESILHTYAKEL